MAIVTGNFANNPNPDKIKDGDIVENFNLMQALPDTPILQGKNVVLRGNGNLINCKLHDGIKIEGSFNMAKKDCCRNLHPDWEQLSVCGELCKHWVRDEKDPITGEITHIYEDTTING